MKKKTRYMSPKDLLALIEQISPEQEFTDAYRNFAHAMALDPRQVRSYLAKEHEIPIGWTLLWRLLAKDRVKLEDIREETAQLL